MPHLLNQSYTFDHAKDAQTGDPRAEFVGNANNPGFYFIYESDTNGGLNPDGRLLFRVRVAAYQTNNQVPTNAPGQYGTAIFVGIDGNADGAIDIFVVADDRGAAASNGVKLYFPSCPSSGAGTCFTGPSKTNLGSQYGTNTVFTSTGSNTNFNWIPVNSTTDPRTGSEPPLNNNIIDGSEGLNSSYRNPDGFFSFAVDFRFLAIALADSGAHTGPNAPSVINNFTPSSTMRFMTVTAQQTNSFNQDTGGCNNNNAIADWACAFSDPIVPLNYVPTPEPATSAVVGCGLMSGMWAIRRRRRDRA